VTTYTIAAVLISSKPQISIYSH